MASNIIKNQKFGSVCTHDAQANGSYVVVGNSSVSNLAISTENIVGATIKRMWWGTTGSWNVLRGANVVAVLSQSGYLGFSDYGDPINLYPAATLVVQLFGTTPNGFIMIELAKILDANGYNIVE